MHTLDLHYLRRLALFGLVGMLVGGSTSFLVRRQYVVRTTFIADTRDPMQNLGALGGLAAQFGLGVPLANSRSPQFFADVIESREVLLRVLELDWKQLTGSSDKYSRVLDYFAEPQADSLRQISTGLRKMRARVATTVGGRTNIIQVDLTGPDPEVSVRLLEAMIASLDHFNRATRHTQARERREFAEVRLAEATDSLGSAESTLRVFLEKNRSYRESPGLNLEYETHQRRINAAQELVTSLRHEFEAARLAEVNDTPVLTVLDPPSLPAQKVAPSRVLWMLGGLALGLLAFAVLFARAQWRIA